MYEAILSKKQAGKLNVYELARMGR